MAPENLSLRTGDALRATGLDMDAWYDVVRRGLFAADPGASPGQYRRFGRDDLIGLGIFRELLAVHIERGHAASIASDCRIILRTNPDIDRLTVVRGADARGNPRATVVLRPPPDALVLMVFSIRLMREAADQALGQ